MVIFLASCKRCPGAIVKRTKRSARIAAVALAFVAHYMLQDRPRPAVQSNASRSARFEGDGPATKIRVFYHLFTKSPAEEERVRQIVAEQFGHLDPTRHDTNVSVTSIGHPPSSLPRGAHVAERRDAGGEDRTLRAVWEHCRSSGRRDAKVVYLHSKGSYHATAANERLRDFVTRAALSPACADLPADCDVCSARMSPLPHPHTSGNMWLARCDYVARLFDPAARAEGALPDEMREDGPCRGRGRYLDEHWVHSHPSVRPCDLYPGPFAWAHRRVPEVGKWEAELRPAPRFKFREYVLPGMCMDEHPDTLSIVDFVKLRKQNYEMLYNITDLDESWWGWEFLQRSIADR